MQKSSLPLAVKTLMRYESEGTLDMHPAVQRKAGLWSNMQKSLLIDSILRDCIIPNIYLKKEIKDGRTYLSVLDGLQRLSSVFSFINDDWVLSKALEPVSIDGVLHDIADKKFSELNEDVRAAISQYRFTSYQLENCTDEEIEDTFSRLNNGLSLSKIQSARARMGIELASQVNELLSFEFFTKNLNLTASAMRREDDLSILLTAMMLLEDFYFGGSFTIKTSASVAEAVRFSDYMRESYQSDTLNRMDTIYTLVEYLDMAFDEEMKKFLKKGNAPIVMYVGYLAYEANIEPEEFGAKIEEFFAGNETEEYLAASGSGNVRLDKVRVRIEELSKYILGEESISEESSEVETRLQSGEVPISEENSEVKLEVEESEAPISEEDQKQTA